MKPLAAKSTEFSRFRSRFFECEIKERLFGLRFRETAFWDYIRRSVFYDLAVEKGFVEPFCFPEQPAKAKALFRELRALIPTLWQQIRIAYSVRTPIDIIFFDHCSKRTIGDKLVDFRGYPFAKIVAGDVNLLVIDPSTLDASVSALYPCPVLSSRVPRVTSSIRARLTRLSTEEDTLLDSINVTLRQAFASKIDVRYRFRAVFLPQFHSRTWVRRLIRIFQPRLIGYLNDTHKKAVVEVAHGESVPVFELQHGVAGAMDLATAYPQHVEELSLPTLQDYILTFGPYWNCRYELPAAKVAVGFPYLEDSRREILARNLHRRDQSAVVCISSFSLGIAGCLDRMAVKMPRTKFYFRLRPEEFSSWQTTYRNVLHRHPNITVIDNNNVALYEYFARTGYLLATASTSVYEAIAFGLVPLIYQGPYHEDVADLVEQGFGFSVSTPEEARVIIESGLRPRSVDATKIFSENSAANIRTAVRKMLERDKSLLISDE